MALFNYATKEITLKIVYYGPGLSGKTTNLQHLHSVLKPETKGKLLSLSTESDRTLFFDFLPVELGKIRDFSIRFQLYTVPGQVRYNATRKVVLKGADAVVFVADSQEDMRDQNIESFENMRENLISNNINPDAIPIILQFNKRDLKNIMGVEALHQDLNGNGIYEALEAVAIDGKGVEETFKKVTKLLLKDIAKKHKIEIQQPEEKKEPVSVIPPAFEKNSERVMKEIFSEQKPFGSALKEPVSAKMPAPEVKPEPVTKEVFSEEGPIESDLSESLSRVTPTPEVKPEPVTKEVFSEEGPIESDLSESLSRVTPAPEVKPEPATKEIISEESPVGSAFVMPEIPKISDAGIQKEMPEKEVSEFGSEREVSESAPVELVEPFRVSAEPEPTSDILSARPEFNEEGLVPEYEIDDADLLEEIEAASKIDISTPIPDAAPGFSEVVEKPVASEQEATREQPRPIFSEPSETEEEKIYPADQPFSAENPAELSANVRELSEKLLNMSKTITLLRQTVSELRTEVKALQYTIMPKKERAEKASEFKDSNEFKELKREQKEIADLVRHILHMLNALKEKKSWFRFF